MYSVIDTNIIHLACKMNMSAIHLLTGFLEHDDLKIGLDNERKLLSEYRKKLEEDEFYKKWIQDMEQANKLRYLYVKLNSRIDEKLVNLKFNGKVDKIVVALAIYSKLNHIVTEDSDFGKGPRGDEHIDVFNYLNGDLSLNVHDVAEAVEYLKTV